MELLFYEKSVLNNLNVKYKPDYRQKIAYSWPKKIDDSIYKFPSGFLKSKQNMIEIPYKMLPKDLILTPKKLKDEFRQSRTKYRRIGLSS